MKPRRLRPSVVWTSLLLLGAPAAGWTQAPGAAAAPAVGASRAHFAEPAFDFGRVMPTEMKRHDFIVTNAGSAPLLVTDVAPGCGCTTTGAWDRRIPPGQSGRIPIEFNPSTFSGPVVKSIVVTTNDPVSPTQVLEIRASVWRPLEVQPAIVSFLPVEDEPRRETKRVRIVNQTDRPVVFQPPESTNPRFSAAVETVREGKEFTLLVTHDPAVGGASHNTAINLRTSLPDQPVLTVTAFALPQPAIVTIPSAIRLPAGHLGPANTLNLVIRNNGPEPLAVSDPATDLPGATVRLVAAEPGRLFYIQLSFSDSFTPNDRPARVSVRTSHPRYRELVVPVIPASAEATAPSAPAGRLP